MGRHKLQLKHILLNITVNFVCVFLVFVCISIFKEN